MNRMRMFALAACLALTGPILAGCSTLQDIGTALTGPPSQTAVTTVAAAENAFTAAVKVEKLWLDSGHATPAQAAQAKTYRQAVYAQVVAARTAVANGDNPGVAVALNLFNQALPNFTGFIAANGGGN